MQQIEKIKLPIYLFSANKIITMHCLVLEIKI